MTYEVWYRAGASLHWWKLDATPYAHDAEVAAKAIEAALKQVGYSFAQAEVRLVEIPGEKERLLASLGYDPLQEKYPAARAAIQQWSADVMSTIDPFAE